MTSKRKTPPPITARLEYLPEGGAKLSVATDDGATWAGTGDTLADAARHLPGVVRAMERARMPKPTREELREVGIHQSQISRILSGKAWSHLGRRHGP